MTEHTLILLRHAKSDWSGDHADIDRPLAARGLRQAPEAGRWLAAHAGPVDLAIVSPAARARATWELAAAQMPTPPDVRVDDQVYAASPRALLTLVRELPEELGTVVLVGHNPGLEDLATHLAARFVPMSTAALAVIRVAGPWAALEPSSATLTRSGRPPG